MFARVYKGTKKKKGAGGNNDFFDWHNISLHNTYKFMAYACYAENFLGNATETAPATARNSMSKAWNPDLQIKSSRSVNPLVTHASLYVHVAGPKNGLKSHS